MLVYACVPTHFPPSVLHRQMSNDFALLCQWCVHALWGIPKKNKKTPPSWQWQLPPYRIANTLDWLDSLLEWANVHTRIYRVPAKADDVSSGESANTGGVLDVSCDRKVSRQHLNQARQNVKRWISIFCVNLSLVPNQLRWLMCIERISKISLNNIEFKKLEL